MLPVREECPAMPGILPLPMLVVHSSVRPKSLTHVEPCCCCCGCGMILGQWVNLISQSFKELPKYFKDFFRQAPPVCSKLK